MSLFDDITGLAHKIEDAVKNEAHKLEGDVNPAEAAVKANAEAVCVEIDTDYRALSAKLAAALKDVLPASWDASHPSADIFAKAKAALVEFYGDAVKI